MTVLHRAGRRRPLPAKPFKKISSDKSVKKDDNSMDTDTLSNDTPNLSSMLAAVQQHLDMFQYEEARDLCLKAVLLAPEDADLRYQLGSICLELGDFQGGFENIRMSLNLEPETTPDRFFAFAQLIPGREAVEVYEHGLKVYAESSMDSAEIKRKVSTACCAAAEIFMTDLCDDEDAEVQCASWLQRALSTDPLNPEAFRVTADLLVCQEKPLEAREQVLRACQLWSEELERLTNPSEDQTVELLAEFPSYESRISAAKILIEIGGEELLDQAVCVLEQLLKEDDSVLMTWYLVCFALKTSQTQLPALEDAIEGALRVSRRDGHLKYPEMQTEDELVLEIMGWAQELKMEIDLDAAEEEEADGAVMDLEEALNEAERLDQADE